MVVSQFKICCLRQWADVEVILEFHFLMTSTILKNSNGATTNKPM